MATAIVIVGGTAILFHILTVLSFFAIDYGNDMGSASIGVGVFGVLFYLIGWLLAIALYTLALVSAGGVAIALVGGIAVSLPIFLLLGALIGAGESKGITPLVALATLALIALYVMALVK